MKRCSVDRWTGTPHGGVLVGRTARPVGLRCGYSLIEMAIVLTVIAALTGLLAAASLALYNDTKNRSAETNAWLVLASQQRHAQAYGSYTDNPEDLTEVGSVVVTAGPSDGPNVASIAVGTAGSVGIAVLRDGERCVLLQAKALDAGGEVATPKGATSTCHGQEALPGLEPAR